MQHETTPDDIPDDERTGDEPAPSGQREHEDPTPGRPGASSRQQTVRGQRSQTGSHQWDRDAADENEPAPLPPMPDRR